jgi:hypothetical protein
MITTIPQISTDTPYKYVGIQLTLDGNMTKQIEDLQSKCLKMAAIFKQTYFNISDAKQGFVTVYTPSIRYPLATTSIPSKTLQTYPTPSNTRYFITPGIQSTYATNYSLCI